MRLGGDGAEGHGGGGEAHTDVLDGLHFLDGNGAVRAGDELQQVLQGHGCVLKLRGDVLLVVLWRAGLDEGVEVFDDRAGDGVHLAFLARTVEAGVAQVHRAGFCLLGARAFRDGLGETEGVPGQGLLGDVGEADASDLGGGAGEAEINDFFANADCLENLRAGVAAEYGDAHLAHDLEHAFFEGFAEVRERLGVLDALKLRLAGGFVRLQRLVNSVKGQIGADGGGAEAEKGGHLVRVARLGGVGDDAQAHAHLLAVQVLMHGTDGEQHRHGDAVVIHGAVAEDEDAHVILHGAACLVAKADDGGLQPGGAFGDRPGHVERAAAVIRQALEFFELVLEEEGAGEVDDFGVVR